MHRKKGIDEVSSSVYSPGMGCIFIHWIGYIKNTGPFSKGIYQTLFMREEVALKINLSESKVPGYMSIKLDSKNTEPFSKRKC